jgi:hypothetical protein
MKSRTTQRGPAPREHPAAAAEPRVTTPVSGVRTAIAACLAGVLLAFVVAAAGPVWSCTEARALGKGIVDSRLETPVVDMAVVPSLVKDIGPSGLRAGWTRILVRWATLQPASASAQNQNYVARLDGIVGALAASKIKIIMTIVDVPKWASKKSLWSSPPPGAKKGAYAPYYAMDIKRPAVRRAFAGLGQYLAQRYKGSVGYFECWNEPNLGSCLYPQKTRTDGSYGARTYLSMLRAFDTGVHRSARGAVVIAGATAPRGGDDAYSTTPQTFARYLKSHGAASSFDAYSHHPYTPRGSRSVAPGAPPNNPARCVTLGNLSQLTSLFPSKPFYLTEYGYGTHESNYFGVAVSPATQAKYLRQAYALAKKRPQVKALLWFLVIDWAEDPLHPYNGNGAYTGLRELDGTRKPAWSVFQGVK